MSLRDLIAHELPAIAPSLDATFVDYIVDELLADVNTARASIVSLLIEAEEDADAQRATRCEDAFIRWRDAALSAAAAASASAAAAAAAAAANSLAPSLGADVDAQSRAALRAVEESILIACFGASLAPCASSALPVGYTPTVDVAPAPAVLPSRVSRGSKKGGVSVSGASAADSGACSVEGSAVPPPPLLVEATARVSRFFETNTTTVDLAGITITVGRGSGTARCELLTDASLRLAASSRYALVGRNGCGKSILLKVLASGVLFDPDAQANLRMMLVSQSFMPPPSEEWTVAEEVRVPPFGYDLSETRNEAARSLRRAELRSGKRGREARTLALAAAGGSGGNTDPDDADKDADEDDAPSPSAISDACTALGIPLSMLGQRYESLSGGWRMRVALAKAVLYKPSFLLLDEPTNHLDIGGCNQLLRVLRSPHFVRTTVIFVSHDLYFINELAENIIRFADGALTITKGNWATLQRERAERKLWSDRERADQEKETARLLASIDESLRTAGRDDKLRKQLAGRRAKVLERGSGMLRSESGHRYKRNSEENAGYFNTLLRKVEVVSEERPVSFRFEEPSTLASSSRSLIEVSSLCFSFPVIDGSAPFSLQLRDFNVERGERVILLGHNGHGKTTLMRLLRQELSGSSETLRVSPSCGVFDQHIVTLLGGEVRSALSYIQGEGCVDEERARRALGTIGLGRLGDTPVKLLSGGQRVALTFALLALSRPALLLLDEPSAHLDLEAREGLARAIAAFEGGCVFISHDVGFIELASPTRALVCAHGRFTRVDEGGWRAAALAM